MVGGWCLPYGTEKNCSRPHLPACPCVRLHAPACGCVRLRAHECPCAHIMELTREGNSGGHAAGRGHETILLLAVPRWYGRLTSDRTIEPRSDLTYGAVIFFLAAPTLTLARTLTLTLGCQISDGPLETLLATVPNPPLLLSTCGSVVTGGSVRARASAGKCVRRPARAWRRSGPKWCQLSPC